MADRLIVKNLIVYAHHGVGDCEKKLGQRYEIDLSCKTSFEECVKQDDYQKTVCYAELANLAADITSNKVFNLIETLGEEICSQILSQFPAIEEITVQVRKPSAPIAHVISHAAIELTRYRAQ